ncbi:unnamed protein product [Calypogeia fissa]
MPGAVGNGSKMEKKKKARRNKMGAISHQSGPAPRGLLTVEEAYSRHQHSVLNGKKSSTIEAVIRDASGSAAQLVQSASSSSFVVRNETATLASEKTSVCGHQESCITEDGSGSDLSEGFESLSSELFLKGASGNGLPCSAVEGQTKRKREEDAVNGGDSEGQLPVKAQKLSEEARVWQYVCKRSVFVSPPQQAKSPFEKDSPFSFGSAPLRSVPSRFGKINVCEEKTTKVDVLVNGKTVKVTVTKESNVAQDWIERQTGKCFGLDLEWQPNRRRGQPDNKVALMQISSETECLLIQMLFLDSIPSALIQFLKDPERKIAGVGIYGDTKKLRRDFGLICGGEVELTTLAVAHFKNEELKRVGLKVLAKHVLGLDMNKSKTVTMSNWSKSYLDRRQVEYACLDAWISHAIFGRLQESSVVAA